ncbi:MAG: Alpha/Beta hydrolase protein [Benniella sp.]|nr:MAG: Alpha/Beta hydrolase protein [Benniella sp.]
MAEKLTGFLKLVVPKVPLIASTTFNHYARGPPKPSWSYRLSLTVAVLRSFVSQLNDVPIRESQVLSKIPSEQAPVDPRAIASEVFISKAYRDKAAGHIDRLLTLQGFDAVKLGWDWKNDPMADEPLLAEWTEPRIKDNKYKEGRTVLYLHGGGYILGSITTHRWATSSVALLAGAKVLSVEYRLAPDSPFPAAVVDAVAAYLFLLNPPADSGATPVNARDIVIMGDSAGGGLTFATMLAIRDADLPMPGGIVGLSPWLDLLHSMPSLLTNTNSDYLPSEGFTQGGEGSLRRVAKLASTLHPDEDLLNHPDMPEVQYYANNAVLHCPYVSPLVEKSLEGACPMLVIAGDGEMLRDEAIVFARKNANASPILHLSMYDDMPHVFPMFDFLPSARHALEEAADFVRRVTGEGPAMANKSFVRVGVDGVRRPLEEDAIVGWEERVGKLGGGRQILASLR